MSLALPFSLPIYSAIPATFGVCCLLSALVGLEYLVAVLQVGGFIFELASGSPWTVGCMALAPLGLPSRAMEPLSGRAAMQGRMMLGMGVQGWAWLPT